MSGTTPPNGTTKTTQTTSTSWTVRPLRYEAVAAPVLTPRHPAGPVPARIGVPEGRVGGEVRAHLTRVVALLLEVLDGRRPLAGVAVLVTPPVARYLRATRQVGRVPVSTARSLRVGIPRPGVAEVAAVCRIEGRPRAVALRFELDTQPDDGPGWRVTVLRVL